MLMLRPDVLRDADDLSVKEAVRKLHGVAFTHPHKGRLVFNFDEAWAIGQDNVKDCLHWAKHSAPSDLRSAVSEDRLAALRSFTGTVMCYILRDILTTPGHPGYAQVLPFAKLVLTGLRALPKRLHVRGVQAYRAEKRVKHGIKDSRRVIYFPSVTSFTTDPRVLAGFCGSSGERTLYEVSGLVGYDIRELSIYPEEREVVTEFGAAVEVEDVNWHLITIAAGQTEEGLVTVKGKYSPTESVNFLKSSAGPGPFPIHKPSSPADAQQQYELGKKYYHGTGVAKDLRRAAELFRKAASQGHPGAQRSLGTCFYNGEGVERDLAKAVRWYRKAAQKGDAVAQFSVGKCIRDGSGVPQSVESAQLWLGLAAQQGHQPATALLQAMQQQ